MEDESSPTPGHQPSLRTPFQQILAHFYATAAAFCAVVESFQPDLVIALAHSGWLPLLAAQEYWQNTHRATFPPITRVNIGREKTPGMVGGIGEAYHNPNYPQGDDYAGEVCAYAVSHPGWVETMQALVLEAIGNEFPIKRILIVDEFLDIGKTAIMALGLARQAFPEAELRFISGELGDSREALLYEWLRQRAGHLLNRLPSSPDHRFTERAEFEEAAAKLVPGSEDIDPSSLGWRKIGPDSPLFHTLKEFLPIEAWLELPRWAEEQVLKYVRERAIRECGNSEQPAYRPPEVVRLWLRQPSPVWDFYRDIHLGHELTTRRAAQLLGIASHRASRQLARLVRRGHLAPIGYGRSRRYIQPFNPHLHFRHITDRSHLAAFCNTFWALPGQLMVGRGLYIASPSDWFKLEWLQQQGITFVTGPATVQFDMGEEGGPANEGDLWTIVLKRPSRRRPPLPYRFITFDQFPSNTGGSIAWVKENVTQLQRLLRAGQVVFLNGEHWHDETGLILGCYLVEEGWEPRAALAVMQRMRHGLPDGQVLYPMQHWERKTILNWRNYTGNNPCATNNSAL